MIRLCALVASVFAAAAHAEQVLVLDTQSYEHLADNSARNRPIKPNSDSLKGSHAYFLAPQSQKFNWASPVNYRDQGQLHVVVDVVSKPSDAVVRLSVCMENPGASCVSQVTLPRQGRVAFNQRPGQGYSAGPNYANGFNWVAIVLRDGGAAEGKKLDLGQGFIGEPSYARYFPMTLRVRAYLVSPGATFVPPPPLGAPMTDAGTADAGRPIADAGPMMPTVDAGHPIDAGALVDAGAIPEAPRLDAGPSTPETPTEPNPTPPAAPSAGGGSGTGAPAPSDSEGGCAAAPGLLLLPLALLAARRRRR